MTHEVLRDFALDAPTLSVLVSLQDKLIAADIEASPETAFWDDDAAKQAKVHKKTWRTLWQGLVKEGFTELNVKPPPEMWDANSKRLKSELTRLRESPDRLPAGLVLLELSSFGGYWPMKEGDKRFKGLAHVSEARAAFLKEASRSLGFAEDRGTELRDALTAAQRSISGFWFKMGIGVLAGLGLSALTLGIAAPFIAGGIGAAMGLSGAAAVSAGLAAIGGGAIAAGGFGMAGGMVVLVGGGAILGAGVGGVAGRAASAMTAEAVLLSAAKLEVVLREFVLQGQRDIAQIQEILFAQRRSIQALEEEIDRLRVQGAAGKDRVANLEKSVKLMRTALERNQGLAAA